MRRHRAALAVPLLVVTAATGCSALGGAVPDADAVLAAVEDVEGAHAGDAELLVQATLGRGVQALPPFVAGDGYSVVVRCLTPGRVEATIDDPQARADGLRSYLHEDITFDRGCGSGMWSAGRRSTGGTVEVTITAPAGTYWVAGVAPGDGVVDSDDTQAPPTTGPSATTTTEEVTGR